MIIACPNCETSFAIPDEVYKPGRKARCSQCSHVFAMPDTAQQPAAPPLSADFEDMLPPEDTPPNKNDGGSKKKRNIKKLAILVCVVLLCLGGLSVGSYMIYGAYKSASQAKAEEQAALVAKARREARLEEARKRQEQDQMVRLITPVNVQQVVVNNKNLGPLVVVTGKMRNDFDEPRDEIVVEVRLLDAEGKVLAKAQQLCGITVTILQLEELKQQELKQVLNNQVDMLVNNTDIVKGGTTPFSIVFLGIPEGFASYEVRPISAKLSPPMTGN